MILILFTVEFAHWVPPSLSLGVLQLQQRVVGIAETGYPNPNPNRWAGYFERLYQSESPAVELDVRDVTIPVADPPINCGPPSFVETQDAVNRLKWGKAPGICGIHAELLKAGGNAVLVSLRAVLCSALDTDIIPTDWKRGLVVSLCKGKGDRQDCINYRGVTLLSVLFFFFPALVYVRYSQDLFHSIHLSE